MAVTRRWNGSGSSTSTSTTSTGWTRPSPIEEKGCTPGQLALAWVLAQDVVPIPGTKRVHYLEENAAADAVRLSDEDLARLDSAAPVGVTAGARYPDMSSVHR